MYFKCYCGLTDNSVLMSFSSLVSSTIEDDTAGAISPCSTIIQSSVAPDLVY